MELDICDFALPVDQCIRMHSKSRHLSVVGWNTHIIHEEGELHSSRQSHVKSREDWMEELYKRLSACLGTSNKLSNHAQITQEHKACNFAR